MGKGYCFDVLPYAERNDFYEERHACHAEQCGHDHEPI